MVLLPLAAHESRRLLATPFNPFRGTVRAFPTFVSTMLYADFRRTVREIHIPLSRDFATCGSSPEVSTAAFSAQPPDLRLTPLMDMDFAITRSLVRRSRLISGFCSSARALLGASFRPIMAPLRSATLHLHQVGGRLALPKLSYMLGTRDLPPAERVASGSLPEAGIKRRKAPEGPSEISSGRAERTRGYDGN